MKHLILSLFIAITSLVNGCATVVSGTEQNLTFNSEPDGATVTVSGRVLGKTPSVVSGVIHEFPPDQYFVTLIPDTATGVSSSTVRRIKEIIIAFSADFRKQLSAGGGEYVDAVASILNVEPGSKHATVNALNQLALSNENDLALAEKIIAIYGVR